MVNFGGSSLRTCRSVILRLRNVVGLRLHFLPVPAPTSCCACYWLTPASLTLAPHVRSNAVKAVHPSCPICISTCSRQSLITADVQKTQLGLRHVRHLSQYVQGVRHLQKLKENEDFCRGSWTEGKFAVLYDLRPLLVPTGERKPWRIAWKSAKDLSEFLKEDFHTEESVVLNCNILDPRGPPKFAVNILPKSEPDHREKIERGLGASAVSGRKAFFVISKTDARILAQCIPLLQWHLRSRFCSNCGELTAKDPSGSKRTCPKCSTIHYPVLSPVAIVLVTNGNSCLVVRQPRFMAGMYSAISGFLEPGESLESAVRREVAEEVGLEVEEVKFYSSQSWAFPLSSLMLGCHASLKPGTSDKVSLDEAELEDSRWLHREEVLTIMERGSPKGSSIWLPPAMAIAHHLLKSWALEKN
ncbi:nucleoside diphosphate-linked moiety X motif 13-like [Acanthaster planci]|uniref:NAD(+) diphosphatase n=1 Tax=Acanthaster planci TaxID=133434 RepID=A0A8B8A3G2_ACAPL|nr:nucleoside diphosphate-linked moiety X motif 13-like [Acanthaster planci]XP_022112234.1 nucleoside diphosphate-linked moiety X motif 13-like [Acanthaster planci]